MANVAALPGVFEQLWLVAGLRWRILRNGLRRKHNVWDLIAMIWVGFFSASLMIGLAFAFFVGGYEFLSKGRMVWFGLLYWGIFLWWQVFPIFVAGFGSNFEFATLLRFPLSMRAFYLLGLGYGLSDFAAISSICWIVAMTAGVGTARLSVVPGLVLINAVFVLLNLTLERLAASWLEKLLAKRKTREVFLGLFILCMVSLNFLSPALQRVGTGTRAKIFAIVPYLSWLPGSLAGDALRSVIYGNSQGYWVRLGGVCLWALATSGLLWRRFAAQHAGEEISESPAAALVQKRQQTQDVSSEEFTLLPPQVGAMVVKEFRYLTRNGMAFLTLLLPPMMTLFFTYQFGPGSVLKEHAIKPAVFYPGIMAYLILILLSPAYNSFAYEGKGMETYFMAPVQFRDVLLGKNVFLMGLVGFELALSLILLTWRVGWPGTPMFLATVMAGAFAILGQLAIANWSSLSFPKKMEIGKMKGQRNSGVAVWTAFGVQIVLGGICAGVLFAGGWMGPWFPSIAFGVLAVAACGGYTASLKAMNSLAEAKKELLIETLTS